MTVWVNDDSVFVFECKTHLDSCVQSHTAFIFERSNASKFLRSKLHAPAKIS